MTTRPNSEPPHPDRHPDTDAWRSDTRELVGLTALLNIDLSRLTNFPLNVASLTHGGNLSGKPADLIEQRLREMHEAARAEGFAQWFQYGIDALEQHSGISWDKHVGAEDQRTVVKTYQFASAAADQYISDNAVAIRNNINAALRASLFQTEENEQRFVASLRKFFTDLGKLGNIPQLAEVPGMRDIAGVTDESLLDPQFLMGLLRTLPRFKAAIKNLTEKTDGFLEKINEHDKLAEDGLLRAVHVKTLSYAKEAFDEDVTKLGTELLQVVVPADKDLHENAHSAIQKDPAAAAAKQRWRERKTYRMVADLPQRMVSWITQGSAGIRASKPGLATFLARIARQSAETSEYVGRHRVDETELPVKAATPTAQKPNGKNGTQSNRAPSSLSPAGATFG